MKTFNSIQELAQANNQPCHPGVVHNAQHDNNIRNAHEDLWRSSPEEIQEYFDGAYDNPYREIQLGVREVFSNADANGWNQELLDEAESLRNEARAFATLCEDRLSSQLMKEAENVFEEGHKFAMSQGAAFNLRTKNTLGDSAYPLLGLRPNQQDSDPMYREIADMIERGDESIEDLKALKSKYWQEIKDMVEYHFEDGFPEGWEASKEYKRKLGYPV